MGITLTRRAQEAKEAFSLVEVSLALVLAAFALVSMLGAIPAGLNAVRESQSQEIATNVVQRLQGSLEQISFAETSSVTTIDTLSAQTAFFTQDGVETADPATADPTSPPAYYKAAFTVGSAFFNDALSAPVGAVFAQASNARTVTITLYYPQDGTTVGKQRFVCSFLVAKHRLD